MLNLATCSNLEQVPRRKSKMLNLTIHSTIQTVKPSLPDHLHPTVVHLLAFRFLFATHQWILSFSMIRARFKEEEFSIRKANFDFHSCLNSHQIDSDPSALKGPPKRPSSPLSGRAHRETKLAINLIWLQSFEISNGRTRENTAECERGWEHRKRLLGA